MPFAERLVINTIAKNQVTVLTGGLDSAVLAAETSAHGHTVFPLYIRFGYSWEEWELKGLRDFLAAGPCSSILPLTVLSLCGAEICGKHWATNGKDVPGIHSPPEAVALPARNLLLLSHALAFSAARNCQTIMLGTLKGNPFPDATASFFAKVSELSNAATGLRIDILSPYSDLNKHELIQRAKRLPLELTFSCLSPKEGKHCGSCNKCAERISAFTKADIEDKTCYFFSRTSKP